MDIKSAMAPSGHNQQYREKKIKKYIYALSARNLDSTEQDSL